MKWRDIIEIGLRNLTSRKSRSALTIGGVGVGIMAIIFLVSLGYGLQRLAISETIQSKSLTFLDAKVGTGEISKIDEPLITKIKSYNNVKNVYPELETAGKLSLPGSDSKIDLIAYIADNNYLKQTDFFVNEGRNFDDAKAEALLSTGAINRIGMDIQKTLNSKIILTPIIRTELLSPDQKSEIPVELTVVGIIENSSNPILIVPINPVKQQVGEFGFSAVKIEVNEKSQVSDIRKQIEDMGLDTDYLGDIVAQMENIFNIVRLILGSFGLIATFVAAMGMFNTLSVSLMERTREIGIMKTLGTQRGDVWKLFLVEGLLISILGGITGITLGVGLGELLNIIFNLIAKATGNNVVDFYYSPPLFLLIILGLVLLLGMIVGFIPARRATKISPLEALRYE